MALFSSSPFKVATVPLVSVRGDAPQNVANVSARLADAALQGVSLVVFPEASLVGYGDTLKLRRRELVTLAEPLDGRSIDEVAKAVERTGVAAGVGFIECAPDGSLFNSYVICMPGGVRCCHRKLHRVEHPAIECGEQYTVLDTKWGVRSVLRMRAQRLREQCFIEDEGGPLEVGLQELASNHLKLRG